MTAPAGRPRILIAGIGNIFLGDDAFGVEVVRRLAGRPLPGEAHVVDYGIRGFDLACALLEGYDVAILVDAVPRGGTPGTLYVIEPEMPSPMDAEAAGGPAVEMHNMDPVKVLRLAAALGGRQPGRILIIGCEPGPFDTESDLDMQMGLSPPVRAAVDEAVELIEVVIKRQGEHKMATEVLPDVRPSVSEQPESLPEQSRPEESMPVCQPDARSKAVTVGGWVLLGVAVWVAIWGFPELRRTLKIHRM
jgi:hydrogenase maturation protease